MNTPLPVASSTVAPLTSQSVAAAIGAILMRVLPERFISDAYALTQMLRARFHQDKIYVYGVSWTSILGVWLALW